MVDFGTASFYCILYALDFLAVSYCHSKGIVHRFAFLINNIFFFRDIKPENIIFKEKKYGKEGILKLVDFGTASFYCFFFYFFYFHLK